MPQPFGRKVILNSNDSHAASATGTASVDVGVSTDNFGNEGIYSSSYSWGSSSAGAETSVFLSASITPSGTNQTIISGYCYLKKITASGAMTARLRETGLAGSVLASTVFSAMDLNANNVAHLTAVIRNRTTALQVMLTVQSANASGYAFGGVFVKEATLSDSHGASLTGTNNDSCSLRF